MSAANVDLPTGVAKATTNAPDTAEREQPCSPSSDKGITTQEKKRCESKASNLCFSLLPYIKSRDDELHHDISNSNGNSHNSSVNSNPGSTNDFVNSSHFNGLSKSIEHCNHFYIQDRRFLEANRPMRDGILSLLRTSLDDATLTTQTTLTTPTLPQYPSTSCEKASAMRIVPNPHISSPVLVVVCVPVGAAPRQTCGTGHLGEYEVDSVHAGTSPITQQQTPYTHDALHGRNSPLDPPPFAENAFDEAEPADFCDGFDEASYTVQGGLIRGVTKPGAELGETTVTHVAPSLKETKVADIFHRSSTNIVNTALSASINVQHEQLQQQQQQQPGAESTLFDVSLPFTTNIQAVCVSPPSAIPTAVDGGGKDHLSPARPTTRLAALYNRTSRNSRRALTGASRRSGFASMPLATLSSPSHIPPMTVSPHGVIDHFRDVYRGPSSTLATPGGTVSTSYPASTPVTDVDDIQASPVCAPAATSSHEAEGNVNEEAGQQSEMCVANFSLSSDNTSDNDGPPPLACTRRQSTSDSCSDLKEETSADDDDKAGVGDADVGAAAFAPLVVTPPNKRSSTGHRMCDRAAGNAACTVQADYAVLTDAAAAAAAAAAAGGAAVVSLPGRRRSPPETSVTAALEPTTLSEPTVAGTEAYVSSSSWLSETRAKGSGSSHSGVACCDEASDGVRVFAAAWATTSPAVLVSLPPLGNDDGDCGSLPTSTLSPPLAPAHTPPRTSAPLSVTPPERCGTGVRPSSLPRRPPRALFSNVTSPQQLPLLEAAAAAFSTPAQACAMASSNNSSSNANAGSIPSPASSASAAAAVTVDVAYRCCGSTTASDSVNKTTAVTIEAAHGTDRREKDDVGAELRMSPPMSLPTSPEEVDLALLVHRHVSQRIAQNYAQSCSYYLHYHSKPGSITNGGRGSYSCPSSPEDYMWDVEDLEEEAPRSVAETLMSTSASAAGDGAANTVGEPGLLSSAVAPRADPFQQQPLRRRFSSAVPRPSGM